MPRSRPILFAAACVALLGVAFAAAQDGITDEIPITPIPDELKDVGIVEKLNGNLPLDATFVDHTGRAVKLGEFFDGKHPVILTLNFYRCPMLCGIQFQELVRGMQGLDMTAGNEFRIVTLSFDPIESDMEANSKRRTVMAAYGRADAGRGWSFLASPNRSAEIQKVLDATGFSVKYVGGTAGWAHKSALIVCTPDGRISRYLAGVQYEPKNLRLALVEASAGKIGTLADQLFLYCFHWDGAQGKYSMQAMNVMRAGGLLIFFAVMTFWVSLWRRGRRRQAGVAVQ